MVFKNKKTIDNKSSLFKNKKTIDNKSSLSNKKKTIHVGDVAEFTITALGLRNIGIDEYSLGYSVLIPNTKLGEKVKAKILKINLKDITLEYKLKKKIKKFFEYKNDLIKYDELNVIFLKYLISNKLLQKILLHTILSVIT